ncbi:MAG: SHOCT-like domain-containing protein [Planctomycetota bacterium]|jgi:hypothetical protein
MNLIWSLRWALISVAFLVVLLLVLKYVARLRWSTAICLVILLGTILEVFGFIVFPHPAMRAVPIILLVAVICGTLLIIQFFHWAASGDDATVNVAERERILRMVEDGKISPEEGSELLDAIGRSTALRGQEKFSRLDMVTLIAAALVILGFFLPWLYIHIGGASGYQAGYDWRALGWAVFIIGVLSAVPVFVTPKDFLYKISMLQIFLTLIGLALVISVLVRVGRHLGAGIIFCLVGFAIAFLASAAKLKRLAA